LAIKLLRVGTIAAVDPLIPGSAAFSPEDGENIGAGEPATLSPLRPMCLRALGWYPLMGGRRPALGVSAAGCAVATSVRIDNGQTTAAILKCIGGTKFSMRQSQRILCAQVFFVSA
jgi:hypothetical protein